MSWPSTFPYIPWLRSVNVSDFTSDVRSSIWPLTKPISCLNRVTCWSKSWCSLDEFIPLTCSRMAGVIWVACGPSSLLVSLSEISNNGRNPLVQCTMVTVWSILAKPLIERKLFGNFRGTSYWLGPLHRTYRRYHWSKKLVAQHTIKDIFWIPYSQMMRCFQWIPPPQFPGQITF